MSKLVAVPLFGRFSLSPDRELQGELCIDGEDSYVRIHDTKTFDNVGPGYRTITGVLLDNTQVTLIDCVIERIERSGKNGAHSVRLFPNYVVTGASVLDPSKSIVVELRMVTDDATSLFYDFDAFGTSFRAKDHVGEIIKGNNLNRSVPIGPDPIVAYFAGKRLIIDVTTSRAQVTAQHNPRCDAGGPGGVSITNSISVHVRPVASLLFAESLDLLLEVLRFLELLVGRPQNLESISLFVERSDYDGLELHWSHQPRRREVGSDDAKSAPHPADVLLSPLAQEKEFGDVLRCWMAASPARRRARDRFHSVFCKQRHYSIDRLVSAANVFDLLPAEAVPRDVVVAPDVSAARDAARIEFAKLPVSDERNSVLNALGRVGKATLKEKVRHRASVMIAASGGRFGDIIPVLEDAVDCRNYYVHGSQGRVNYAEQMECIPLFTDALVFVFAMSELIDCGWDPMAYLDSGTTMSHPFGSFRVNYRRAAIDWSLLRESELHGM